MRPHLLAVMLLGGACSAAGAQPAVDAELRATRDSDDFSERTLALGWTSSAGAGLRVGAMRYTAPGWQRSGRLLAATYRRHAAGSRLDLSAGAAELGDFTHGVGSLEYLRELSPGSSLGVSAERNYVDSVRSIESGVRFTHVALVGDHRFGERFDVGVSAGALRFSNDNTRRQLRTRWNFSLHEPWGLNLFLKTRHHWNSHPYRPEYFSPERLQELSLGLSSRVAVAGALVLSLQADAGRQRTEFDSKPLWSYSLGLGSPRSSRIGWRVALQASNAASSSSTEGGYRHASLVAQLTLPF